MYHIKNDKRAERSALLICNALFSLMDKKSYEEITISDIQQYTGVSRSTFYRNFDTMDDVLRLKCDLVFEDIFSRRTLLPLCVVCFEYWYDNNLVMEKIMRTGHINFITLALKERVEKDSSLARKFSSDADLEYFSSMLSYAMVGFLATWIERGKKESKAQMLRHVVKALRALTSIVLPYITSYRTEE